MYHGAVISFVLSCYLHTCAGHITLTTLRELHFSSRRLEMNVFRLYNDICCQRLLHVIYASKLVSVERHWLSWQQQVPVQLVILAGILQKLLVMCSASLVLLLTVEVAYNSTA